MKKIITLMSFTILTAWGMAQPLEFTIATININRFDNAYNPTSFTSNMPSQTVNPLYIDLAHTYLSNKSYSIICFQELAPLPLPSQKGVKNSVQQYANFIQFLQTQYTLVAQITKDQKPYYGGDQLQLRIGIAYDKNIFKQVQVIPFKPFNNGTLLDTQSPPKPIQNGFMGVVLENKNNPTEKVGIICTHFKGGPVNQAIQTSMAQNITNEIATSGYSSIPWIVCGDFNAVSASLTGVFSAPAWQEIPVNAPFTVVSGSQIYDHIFYTGPMQVTGIGVFPTTKQVWQNMQYPDGTIAPWFTDHASVFARFKLGQKQISTIHPQPVPEKPEKPSSALPDLQISPETMNILQSLENVQRKGNDEVIIPELLGYKNITIKSVSPTPGNRGPIYGYITSLDGAIEASIQNTTDGFEVVTPSFNRPQKIFDLGLAVFDYLRKGLPLPTKIVTPANPQDLYYLAEALQALEKQSGTKTTNEEPSDATSGQSETTYKKIYKGVSLIVERNDILQTGATAVVNAANESCQGGGGIDGYITNIGGGAKKQKRHLIKKRKGIYTGQYAVCPTGEARLTISGDIKEIFNIPYVLHAVGPVCSNKPEDAQLLKGTYYNSLLTAEDFNQYLKDRNQRGHDEFENVNETTPITSIAFPAISAGIFGCPIGLVVQQAITAAKEFIDSHPTSNIKTIYFILLDNDKKKEAAFFTAFAQAIHSIA